MVLVHQKYYTVKDVADRLGIAESKVRYWESQFGEFLRGERDVNNYRVFVESDLEIFTRLKALQGTGNYTIEGLKGALKEKKQQEVTRINDELREKLLVALNSLASEIGHLRREIKEEIREEFKREVRTLAYELAPPKPKKKWWEVWK